MSKAVTLSISGKAEDTATGFSSKFGKVEGVRSGLGALMLATVVTVADGATVPVPLGTVTAPSVFCGRRLSGGAVQVGFLVGGVTFYCFAHLYASDAFGVPLPTVLPGPLYLKNDSGTAGDVELWVQ